MSGVRYSEPECCPLCKSAGEMEGYVSHPSGDPQDESLGIVQCPDCNGSGELPHPAYLDLVAVSYVANAIAKASDRVWVELAWHEKEHFQRMARIALGESREEGNP